MQQVKQGQMTTEYRITQDIAGFAKVGFWAGVVAAVGGAVLESFKGTSILPGEVLTVIGAVVAVAAQLSRTLVSREYIKSRTVVKAAASQDKPNA